MEMRGGTPAEMDKRMKDDIVKWGAVIEKAGIEKRD
jgi:tripartite-type tricarboxylate transporter receptor subunit TctC